MSNVGSGAYCLAMNVRTLPGHNRPLRAALYGRASHDPKRRGRSIKDQFAVAELECSDHGWTVAGYYEDRDRSASRRATKTRERFEQLILDIKAGLIDVIVYAEKSRTSRNMAVSIKLRELCEETGVLLSYDSRVFDMSKPADRREFTRDALQAEEEAEVTIDRALRTARLNAKRGAPHGIAPFGYTRRYDPDDGVLLGQFPHPEHAAVVRQIFEKAAAGEAVLNLTPLLKAHVPSANRSSLRKLLRNRAYIGVRMHKGRAMEDCQWEGIVSPSLFLRVQKILDAPERKVTRDGRVKHLLSRLAVCAQCVAEGAVREQALVKMIADRKGFCYRCPTTKGHVYVREELVDAVVEAAVFEWLGSPAAVAAFRPAQDDGEVDQLMLRIAAMKEQLEQAQELASTFDAQGVPQLSMQSLAATEQRLLPLIAAAEKTLEGLMAVSDPVLTNLIGAPLDVVSRVWNEELSIPQRRHVVRAVVNVSLVPTYGVRPAQPIEQRVTRTFVGEPGFVPSSRPQRAF